MKWRPLWEYIKEREYIRLKKEAGDPWPWSKDPMFQKYKFTNVKRENDRTTKAFIQVYKQHRNDDPHIVLYNCGVRRFFGTVEFSDAVGWLRKHDLRKLKHAVAKATKPWTGAYMVRAGIRGRPKVNVVGDYLRSLWDARRRIVRAIDDTATWRAGYEVMMTCYGFGSFMCKEVLQDYLLWLHINHHDLKDAADFTPIGPGARRGIQRLLGHAPKINHDESEKSSEELLKKINWLRSKLNPLWEKEFPEETLLTAHDVQFCLCELSKYQRGYCRSTYSPPEQR